MKKPDKAREPQPRRQITSTDPSTDAPSATENLDAAGSLAPRGSASNRHRATASTSLLCSGRNPDGTFQRGNQFRFRPGNSGNPKGRPKGRSRFLSDRMRSNMLTPFPGDPDGRTFGEVMVDKVSAEAVKGDFKSFLEVLDRLEGRSRQVVEKSGSESDSQRWVQIGSKLLARCADNPDARRAILEAFAELDLEDDSDDEPN
jgi:hypothetical protein